MGSREMSCLDLESGVDQVSHCRRVSSAVATDCVVDIDQNRADEVRISVEIMERECRICMLSLESESKIAMEIGCSCKNELAAVHQHCAQTWFGSKGNRICEICKSVAQNVVIPNKTIPRQQIFEVNRFLINVASVPAQERNTFPSNAISVPVSGHNAPSTNTISRNSDLAFAPQSWTEDCMQVGLICGILVLGVLIIFAFFSILALLQLFVKQF